MQTWRGEYFDGERPRKQSVSVRTGPGGLEIVLEDGAVVVWQPRDIRLLNAAGIVGDYQLQRAGSDELLVVMDRSFPAETIGATGAGRGLSRTLVHAVSGRGFWLVVPASALIVGLVYLWGVPSIANALAPLVPVAWEERVGARTVASLGLIFPLCAGSPGSPTIDALVAPLAAVANGPYTFRVQIVRAPIANAMAAPGGHIVLMQGLIREAESAEEVAGVLAHEMEHVLLRHTTRALVRGHALELFAAAVAGQNQGLTRPIETARALGALRYSREQEDEADAVAVNLLSAAGIDPRGLATFLRRAGGGEFPTYAEFLASHPAPSARAERIEQMAKAGPWPQLGGLDQLKGLCGE